MIIYSIFSYDCVGDNVSEPIIASINQSTQNDIKKYEKEIIGVLKRYPNENYKLIVNEYVYYGFNYAGKINVLAINRQLTGAEQEELFSLISLAQDEKDLSMIIQSKNSINAPATALEELQKELIKSVNKVVERSDHLEELLKNTEILKTNSAVFKQKATDLKHSQHCPFFFPLYKTIRSLIWTEPELVEKPAPGPRKMTK